MAQHSKKNRNGSADRDTDRNVEHGSESGADSGSDARDSALRHVNGEDRGRLRGAASAVGTRVRETMSPEQRGQLFTVLAAAATGAALMYFLDPDRGADRRRGVVDGTTGAARRVGEGASSAARRVGTGAGNATRAVRDRASGMAGSVRDRFRGERSIGSTGDDAMTA